MCHQVLLLILLVTAKEEEGGLSGSGVRYGGIHLQFQQLIERQENPCEFETSLWEELWHLEAPQLPQLCAQQVS